MKPKVYIETTIPSYLVAKPSRDVVVAGRQELTREWWEVRRKDFSLYISQFVIDEAILGDPDMAQRRLDVIAELEQIEISDAIGVLAERIIDSGAIPLKAATDAAHIAVAAVQEMDYLLTWNCKHIANAEISRTVRKVCEEVGLVCPVICTPEELMGEEDYEN